MLVMWYNKHMFDELLHKTLKVPYELHAVKHGNWADGTRPIIVLVHGIGANLHIWDEVIATLGSAPMLAVDLLGFGESRKPDWSQYSLADHAAALAKTIRRHAPGRPIVLCGHSLGTLVSIEYARQFPKRVRSLVLCAPPIYRPHDMKELPLREAIVKAAGKKLLEALESTPKIVETMNYYREVQENFHISEEGAKPFVQTARNSIWHQTSFADAIALPDLPLTIIYGTLDAVMVPANFKEIKCRRQATTAIRTAIGGHEIRGRFAREVIEVLRHDYGVLSGGN